MNGVALGGDFPNLDRMVCLGAGAGAERPAACRELPDRLKPFPNYHG